MKNDFRDLAATLVNDKLKEYLDNRLAIFQSEFEKKLNALKSDVDASTDISLKASLEVDSLVRTLRSAFGPDCGLAIYQGSSPKIITKPVAAQAHPAIANGEEGPKEISKAAPTKPNQKTKEPKKGLEDLEPVRNEKWAKVIEKMNIEFAVNELEFRILFFLHECGPQTPHDLKTAGVWRATNSVTRFLENMEADGLVRFLVAEKKWAITTKGITELGKAWEDDEPENNAKIEEGLTEALAFARGEPNHAKVTRVPIETTKPALSIVPSGPRILKPVEPTLDIASSNLTFVEKAMVALLRQAMTIEDLQKAIGHTSGSKSLINMLWNCKQKDGYVEFSYEDGRVYRLTEKGRAYITKIVPQHQALAAS